MSRARTASRAGRHLLLCLLFTAMSALLALAAHAQGSLSPPLGASLSDSIYQDSQQNGTLSTLPGGGNLTDPNLRTGINDPLGFLLETGTMSPYPFAGSQANSYVTASISAQTLTDPFLALQAGEYRNNHAFMAGAGGRSLGGGRAIAAGGMVPALGGVLSARQQAMLRGAGAGSFAAGSSASPEAMSGGAPAGAALAMTMSSGTAGIGMPAAGAQPTSADGMGAENFSDGMGQTASEVSAPAVVRQGADAMPFGPAPGDPFPMLTTITPSTTGFEDSTMGTAGLVAPRETDGPSPLLSGRLNGDAASPFPETSSDTSGFLHPSLHGTAVASSSRAHPAMSLREFTREARLHALVTNPNAMMPSPFEERAMQRAFVQQQQRGRGRRSGTVPSIVPNP